MPLSPLAGKKAPQDILIDVADVRAKYYALQPNTSDPAQLVAFGTSGHRGSSLAGTFTEAHVLAITQAICDYRKAEGVSGPLYMGKDTHALSGPAQVTALEVLGANQVETVIQSGDGVTPTPVISRAILVHNRDRYGKSGAPLADGVVVTPSHNPPADGGFKYNPTNGGPAASDVTNWIQNRANELLRAGNEGVRRISIEKAMEAPTTRQEDLIGPYVQDLSAVVDMDCIQSSGIKLGVDPLGGAAVPYWAPIQEAYGLDLGIVNTAIDPTFSFMTVDHDGKIRTDCSSPYAMAGLIAMKDRFRLSFGNDADCDRHGIVTPSGGLMNPNHFLAVAIDFLLKNRPNWKSNVGIGKTLVSSGMIDRVVRAAGRKLLEVPVGFKWFAPGLFEGSICFGGEESAGASFLRRDGTVWTTDKDGMIMDLLAAEITARTGKDPSEHYRDLATKFGSPVYSRTDIRATREEMLRLLKLSAADFKSDTLAGEPVQARITHAPGNGAAIGGLKVTTENGWFAIRPSGTEPAYKIYAESFKGQAHLEALIEEAKKVASQKS